MVLFHIKSFTFLAAYRYVASDLATDVVVNVGDVKFYLHKVKLKSQKKRKTINQETHRCVTFRFTLFWSLLVSSSVQKRSSSETNSCNDQRTTTR